MSDVRAVRKRQQLNNLVAMVTELARPSITIVDFCSGTVRTLRRPLRRALRLCACLCLPLNQFTVVSHG